MESSVVDVPPGAPALMVPPTDNIRNLILEKEKELHDINDYRIRTLEGLLREKENGVNDWKQKFHKLKEDFQYNLKLIEDRDEELDKQDMNFNNLKNVLRDRDSEMSDMKIQIADLNSYITQEKNKSAEQDQFYQKKLKELRDELEGSRWNFDDEQRQYREEIDSYKRNTERQLREKEEELDATRRDITATFDDVMRQREAEYKQKTDSQASAIRELELRIKSSNRELEQTRERNTEMRQSIEALQLSLQEAEKHSKTIEWELQDVRQLKEAKISELEEEKMDLQTIKQSLLDEYEGKMSELLQSLHSVERAFIKQKEHYEEELKRAVQQKNDEMKTTATRFEGRVEALSSKLRSTEESLDRVQSEFKQAKWEFEDQLSQRNREIETIKADTTDSMEQRDSYVTELKNQLWNRELELKTSQDKVDTLTRNFEEFRDKISTQRSTLLASSEREEELKKQLITQNLAAESRVKEVEADLVSRHEIALREVTQTKDRLVSDKQASDERLAHTENELARVRSELSSLRSQVRLQETFGNSSPSPMFDGDYGAPSPIKGMGAYSFTPSPQRQAPPPSTINPLQVTELEAQNEKLRQVIADMRVEMEKLIASSSSPSPQRVLPEDKNENYRRLERHLNKQQQYCAFMQKKLEAFESNDNAASDSNAAEELVMLRSYNRELNDMLSTFRSQVEAAEEKTAALEKQLQELKTHHPVESTTDSLQQVDTSEFEAEIATLKSKLEIATADVERLVDERKQLMEANNKLRASMNDASDAAISAAIERTKTEMAGHYERKIVDVAASLKEFKAHNKTLRRELKRIRKTSNGDNEYAPSEESSSSSAASSRRPSLQEEEEQVLPPPPAIAISDFFKEEEEGKLGKLFSSSSAASLPKTVEEDEGDDIDSSLKKLSLMKAKRRGSEVKKSSGSTNSISRSSSDARLKLKQAREMLELSGKKAEVSTNVTNTKSRRMTESQIKVGTKLKAAQKKRAEMTAERKKVRNYSIPDNDV